MSTSTESLPETGERHSLKDFQTRFLYPFVLDRWNKGALKALCEAKFGTRSGQSRDLWCSQPHPVYRDELLNHVTAFLFPDPSAPSPVPNCPEAEAQGCCYLRVADEVAHKWFHGTEIPLSGGATMPVDVVAGVGIELFLSPQGIGVLSLALRPAKEGLSHDEAIDFNYRIAQFRRRQYARFHKKHRSEQPGYDKLSPDQKAAIPPPPEESTPLVDRLGVAGGSFDLLELIEHLLGPLESYGLPPVRKHFEEFLVYTVARFGPEVDFADKSIRDLLAPDLAKLAQVEEPAHSGTSPELLSVPNEVLNRRHWAAVGLLGAAHLVADQPPQQMGDRAREVGFNEQKVSIVRDKYFIPYLIALLQRLVLNRAIEEAGRIVREGDTAAPGRATSDEDGRNGQEGDDITPRLSTLRKELLEFGVGGHFTQVSTRHALHRFYQLARNGLDIPAAWEEVRRAIADLDAQATAENQARLTRNAKKDLDVITRVQNFLHLIEYFLVSVYHAHLWHMFAAENESLKDWASRNFRFIGLNGDWFVSLGVIAFAGFGLLVAWVLNLFLERGQHGKGPTAGGEGHPGNPDTQRHRSRP